MYVCIDKFKIKLNLKYVIKSFKMYVMNKVNFKCSVVDLFLSVF